MRFNLKVRYSIVVVGVMLTAAAAVLVAAIYQSTLSFEQFQDASQNLYSEQIAHRAAMQGQNLAEQLADNLANPLYYFDLEAVRELVEIALAHPDIEQVDVLDTEYKIIHQGERFHKQFGEEVEIANKSFSRRTLHESALLIKDDYIEVLSPILIGEQLIGRVLVRYSLVSMQGDKAALVQTLRSEQAESLRKLIHTVLLTALLLALLAVFGGVVIASRMRKPIIELASFARSVGEGNFSQQIVVDRNDELGDLATSLNDMTRDLDKHTGAIEFMAYHDSLTGLPNRRSFLNTLNEAARLAVEQDSQFSLLFIDIDDFKLINDRYGHKAGDYVLGSVAERMTSCIRASDVLTRNLNEKDSMPFLARLAGDEFIVLLTGVKRKTDVATICQRIIDSIARPYAWEDRLLTLSISIGVAAFPGDGDNAEAILQNADAAMYYVKNHDKNGYHFFNQALNVRDYERHEILDDLTYALTNEKLQLWFQPQIDLATGKVFGAEALLRWEHPEKGFISPDKFIPIAEKSEIIHVLGLWVVKQAYQTLRKWHGIDPALNMSVNVSASQLKQGSPFEQELIELLEKDNLLRKLHLEMTETFLLKEEEQAAKTLASLRMAGACIWLDDFGTGYSALAHLQDFPVDGVKIDRSFINELDFRWEKRALTEAVVAIARAFKLQVIAEGVETEKQQVILQELGCDIVQGYYYAKPMPADEFEQLLKSKNIKTALRSIVPNDPA